ncbi:superoxide dismutase, partial [Gigaspora rosea]
MTHGLTNTSGMYPYHVHEHAYYDGSCDSTGGHLDPYGVGNVTGYVCDPNTPDKCEAGDLSGKHGKLQGTLDGNVMTKYTDQYISLNGTTTLENGVIGRAVVIHQTYAPPGASPARIACANIIEGNCSQKIKQKRTRRRRQMI